MVWAGDVDVNAWVEERTPAVLGEAMHEDADEDEGEDKELRAMHVYRVR